MEENNNMKIGVLTDSSSYLTKEQCEKYGIGKTSIPYFSHCSLVK